LKQPATSFGCGYVAGIANRYRKSPVGLSRWNVMWVSSGTSMPETGCRDVSEQVMPLITPQ